MKIDTIKVIKETRGDLGVIEFLDLPFIPQRVFYITNVPKGILRGHHAHINLLQYAVCLEGQITVYLNDGHSGQEYILNPGQGILIDKMIWDYQEFMTGKDVMMVLCSQPYNRADYIENYEQFQRLCNNLK